MAQALIADTLRKWRDEAGDSLVPINLRALLEQTLTAQPNRRWDEVITDIASEGGS